MRWIEWVTIGAIVLVAIGTSIKAYGSWRWQENAKILLSRLDTTRSDKASARYDPSEIIGLPMPVQRYFKAVLKDGQPMMRAVTLAQTGTFSRSETDPSWKHSTASQRVTTLRPGFVWDARNTMYPGIAVHVHDAYIAGEGILHAALFGVITMANVSGGRDAAEGELMRYLPEAT